MLIDLRARLAEIKSVYKKNNNVLNFDKKYYMLDLVKEVKKDIGLLKDELLNGC